MRNQNFNKLMIGLMITMIILMIFLMYLLLSERDNSESIRVQNDSNMIEKKNKIDDQQKQNSADSEDVNQGNSDGIDNTISEFDVSKFDTTKEAINGTSGWAYKPVENDVSSIGLSIRLSKTKKSAVITIDWGKYFDIYGTSVSTGEIRNYEITNFTKNIREVYIGGFGQSSGYETAFYVMEDGTVEYTPIMNALGNNGSSSETIMKSYGKINDVSGVVKIITGTDYCLNDQCMGDGAFNILGIKADGTFYNLSNILNKASYYSF